MSQTGYAVFGVVPDLPEKAGETRKKLRLDYPIYSDPPMQLAQDFGLAYVQNDPRYASLLEESSGMDHHLLPVPAVILIGPDKAIQFLHADPRYTLRLPADVLLAAARAWAPKEEQ